MDEAAEKDYEKYISESVGRWRQNGDFENALWELSLAERVFGENRFAELKNEFEALRYDYEKQNAKNYQSIYSYNERISHTDANEALLVAQVKNNTDKKLVGYEVAFCGYDKDGKKVSFQGPSAEYIICRRSGISAAAGSDTGGNFGWGNAFTDTAEKVNKLSSCVISAVFEDGTVWNNPYYTYWCTENFITV